MNWLFQSVPKRCNLAERMRQGETETWLVTRYMDEIKRGDLVFLWMGGPPEVRGLYGWGRTVSDAPSYFKGWGFGVDVLYERKFTSHIPFDIVKALPTLTEYILFRMAVGTNFRLSEEQTSDLKRLIADTFGVGEAP